MKKQPKPIPSQLTNIAFRAKQYADARAILGERAQALQAQIDKLRRQHLDGIVKAAAATADYRSALFQEIHQHPELFTEPRTVTVHGIKVGFQKGKGRLVWDDEEKVLARIRKLFTDEEAALLIATVAKPAKEALLLLDAATLKKLGCTVEGTGDEIVIKDTAGEIDRLVQRFLDEAAKKDAASE